LYEYISKPAIIIIDQNLFVINLSDGTTEDFSVPRAGYITAISASFTTVPTPDSETTVRARIYRAAADSTISSWKANSFSKSYKLLFA